jgi:RsiW-degrading membrane proteinase PrsW (M82 family)
MFLDYTTEWLSNMSMTFIGFIAPILYFIWMYRNDRYEKEPLSLIVFLAGWGIVSAFIAGYLNSYIMIPLLGTPGAAFTEEPLKALGVYWLARHKKLGEEFNDHLDGLVYGAAAGAGFAGSENFYYIYRYVTAGTPLTEIALIRSIAALGHIVYTGLIGRVLGVAKVRRGRILPFDLLAALPAGIIPHFIWNAVPDFFGFTGILILYCVYAYLFSKNIVAAQKDEERWNFKVYAPLE